MREFGRHYGLTASLEDYLETIYLIVSKHDSARVRDISSRLGVSKSSVTGALHALSNKHLINYAPYGSVTLTEDGERLAREVFDWHSSIKAFLMTVLLLEEEMADETACAMEHCLPREIVERMAAFVKFSESECEDIAHIREAFCRFCSRDSQE